MLVGNLGVRQHDRCACPARPGCRLVKTITSRRHPNVKRYRDAASGRADAVMLLDGSHLIFDATRARVRLLDIAYSERGLAIPGVARLLDDLARAGVATWSVSGSVLEAMSPAASPSGIVALAAKPSAPLARALSRAPQLVVIAVDVQDPGNVGAIVRSSEAGGATAAVFAGASADPFGWKALRGAMGSTFRVPVVTSAVQEAIAGTRAAGVRLLATTPRAERSLFDVDLRGPVAFLVGSEGAGLAEELLQAADDTIRVPMRAPVESLNVAVASALLVYEAFRQRNPR